MSETKSGKAAKGTKRKGAPAKAKEPKTKRAKKEQMSDDHGDVLCEFCDEVMGPTDGECDRCYTPVCEDCSQVCTCGFTLCPKCKGKCCPASDAEASDAEEKPKKTTRSSVKKTKAPKENTKIASKTSKESKSGSESKPACSICKGQVVYVGSTKICKCTSLEKVMLESPKEPTKGDVCEFCHVGEDDYEGNPGFVNCGMCKDRMCLLCIKDPENATTCASFKYVVCNECSDKCCPAAVAAVCAGKKGCQELKTTPKEAESISEGIKDASAEAKHICRCTKTVRIGTVTICKCETKLPEADACAFCGMDQDDDDLEKGTIFVSCTRCNEQMCSKCLADPELASICTKCKSPVCSECTDLCCQAAHTPESKERRKNEFCYVCGVDMYKVPSGWVDCGYCDKVICKPCVLDRRSEYKTCAECNDTLVCPSKSCRVGLCCSPNSTKSFECSECNKRLRDDKAISCTYRFCLDVVCPKCVKNCSGVLKHAVCGVHVDACCRTPTAESKAVDSSAASATEHKKSQGGGKGLSLDLAVESEDDEYLGSPRKPYAASIPLDAKIASRARDHNHRHRFVEQDWTKVAPGCTREIAGKVAMHIFQLLNEAEVRDALMAPLFNHREYDNPIKFTLPHVKQLFTNMPIDGNKDALVRSMQLTDVASDSDEELDEER